MIVITPCKMDAATAGKVLDGDQQEDFIFEDDGAGVVDVGALKVKVCNVDEGVSMPAVDDVTSSFTSTLRTVNTHSP